MTEVNFGANMLLVSSYWGESKSFKLIPANNECPFVEAMYDPTTGLLAVIGKTRKQVFHMVHKVDDLGDIVETNKRKNGKPYKEERRTIDTFVEYYIIEADEIISFIKDYALNTVSFDFMKFIEAQKEMENNPVAMPDSPSIKEIVEKAK
jgi:hypothetical protein